MKNYRPKRITIRLTEDEHQALAELRSGHAGSYQEVVMNALQETYRLSDFAQAIRQQRHLQATLPYVQFGYNERGEAYLDYHDPASGKPPQHPPIPV